MVAPLAGQGRPVEVGVDAAFKWIAPSDDEPAGQTALEFPVHALRLGIGVTQFISIETSGFFERTSSDGGESSMQVLLFPSVVLSGGAEAGAGAFLAVGIGIAHARSVGGLDSRSATQLGLGGQFGLRVFLSRAFALRGSLGLTQWREAEFLPASKYFAFLLGFSAFP